jgi:hypothetical protein
MTRMDARLPTAHRLVVDGVVVAATAAGVLEWVARQPDHVAIEQAESYVEPRPGGTSAGGRVSTEVITWAVVPS